MTQKFQKIDKEMISEMMYGEEKYIREFAEASISSFSEFKKNFSEHLLNRDMENLRKAGHKIKPAALMLNLDGLMDLYEMSKEQIEKQADVAELKDTVSRMSTFCEQVINDFEQF